MQRAGLQRFGAGEERLAEDARTSGNGEPSVVAIDVHEGDAVGHLERARSGGRQSALIMKLVQMGSAACAPLRPSAWLSSKPTQTTVSSSGVKPTNQASRRSLVVPVLPAASSAKPDGARGGAGALVDDAAHHVGDEERRVRPGDAPAPARAMARCSSCPSLDTCRIVRSGRISPKFGNSV